MSRDFAKMKPVKIVPDTDLDIKVVWFCLGMMAGAILGALI